MTVLYRGAAALFGSFATPGGIPAWDVLFGDNPDGPGVEGIVAKYPDQFAVEFARGVVWGFQPMVHNFTMGDVGNPRLASDLQFMKDTAQFYFAHREFLFDGEMLAPAAVQCATRRVDFLMTSSYTRPDKSASVTQDALPAVFHSVWRAPDGRRAAVLVNWTQEPQRYAIAVEGAAWSGEMPARAWRLESLDRQTKR